MEFPIVNCQGKATDINVATYKAPIKHFLEAEKLDSELKPNQICLNRCELEDRNSPGLKFHTHNRIQVLEKAGQNIQEVEERDSQKEYLSVTILGEDDHECKERN